MAEPRAVRRPGRVRMARDRHITAEMSHSADAIQGIELADAV